MLCDACEALKVICLINCHHTWHTLCTLCALAMNVLKTKQKRKFICKPASCPLKWLFHSSPVSVHTHTQNQFCPPYTAHNCNCSALLCAAAWQWISSNAIASRVATQYYLRTIIVFFSYITVTFMTHFPHSCCVTLVSCVCCDILFRRTVIVTHKLKCSAWKCNPAIVPLLFCSTCLVLVSPFSAATVW